MKTRRAALVLLLLLGPILLQPEAHAASTFNPTVLVNTESFQTIDEGDGSTSIGVRFGQTLNESLLYNQAAARFQLSRGLVVGGDLTSTGALFVHGTMSGSALRLSRLATSGAVVYSSGSALRNTARGASGNLLISQGAAAPQWKAPTGSLVWYMDGGLAVTTTGSAVITLPFAMTATSVNLNAKVAPTGTGILVNIRKNGTTIFSAKPGIYAGYRSGGTGAVFSITDLPANAVITMDIDRVGSTLAGSGLTIMLNGTRKY